MIESDPYDCIIVGAGPAGLSASLFLARYLRRTLTFHHNSPRNEYAHGVHGFLGHHGIPPAELLARGRDEVTTHGGLIIEACDGYEVKDKRVAVVTRPDNAVAFTKNPYDMDQALNLADRPR